MKLVIAGSRHLNVPVDFIDWCLGQHNILELDEVVCGKAKGIDTSGEDFAKTYDIPIVYFPADWDALGRIAGPIRNGHMATYGDALLLIWDGQSSGSANMKTQMQKLNKPVYEIILKVKHE